MMAALARALAFTSARAASSSNGLAEMILGALDLLLNFWRGHRSILPQSFPGFPQHRL